ncbi:unnamed protein product [Adineta steineri]|uniref:Uncharacterized protein n=1 Tax=Adineta steineri TaxID=433720 RepID=A0A813NDS2_9BILA|nr:unnamed protein product [Adineta steineri]CAF4095305.1 unnamed protein product [Adineta steineri]
MSFLWILNEYNERMIIANLFSVERQLLAKPYLLLTSPSYAMHNFQQNTRKQLQMRKELYVTPMVIILSSLPQVILSFTYACTELKQSWQRYLLLTTYFLSYLPQVLGFALHVIPSKVFKKEFQQTIIGKRLIKRKNG